jgi:hypothetical protein
MNKQLKKAKQWQPIEMDLGVELEYQKTSKARSSKIGVVMQASKI